MTSTYLYGIMAGEHRFSLGCVGLPDGSAPVCGLPGGGLTAVVGEYRGPTLAQLPRHELLRYLSIHQRVIERAMEQGPLLPARLGTILTCRREVHSCLRRWNSSLEAALQQMGGAIEIELAATWDLPSVFAEIGREPEIATLATGLAGLSPEESAAHRTYVGRLVKESLDRRRNDCRQQTVAALAPWAIDVQPHILTADEFVLNVAFLLRRSALDSFYDEVHRLDAANEGKLSFRCLGPLPPYSFASVEILRPDAAEVGRSRRLLALDERFSEEELTAAYRRQAALAHPDRHPADPEAPQRFATLVAAYARLVSYCRGQACGAGPSGNGGNGHGLTYDLSPAALARGPLLAIRRLEAPALC